MQDAAAFNCSALAVPIFCLLSCARVSEKTGSKSMGEENWRRISFEVLTKIPESQYFGWGKFLVSQTRFLFLKPLRF